MDQRGQVLRSGRVPNLQAEMGRFLEGLEGLEAVWPAIRADFNLRRFYERLARNKGANKARVATARRLLAIIYKVWK
jgi:hypothetical protein